MLRFAFVLCAFALASQAKTLIVELTEPSLARSYAEHIAAEARLRGGVSKAPKFKDVLREERLRTRSEFGSFLSERRKVIERQQGEVLSGKKWSVVENGKFSVLVNALAVRVDDADVPQAMRELRALPGVRKVSVEKQYKLNLFDSVETVNLEKAFEALGNTDWSAGKGVRIAVVDSGVYTPHPMFNDTNFSWPEDIPAPGLGQTENCNAKVIVSRKYFNPDDPPYEKDRETYPANFSSNHGIHVASTAAGIYVENASYSLPNGTMGPMWGMAPGAYILNYRIFYTNTKGYSGFAGDTQIIQAFEDVTNDGADICQNSWGSVAFMNKNDIIEEAIRNMNEAGVVVVFSAGNDGSSYLTLERTDAAIRVAASTTKHHVVQDAFITYPYTYPEISFMGTDFTPKCNHTQMYNMNILDDADVEGCDEELKTRYTFTKDDAVLVRRGNCSFSTKINNVQAAGAGAIFVYNNYVFNDGYVSMANDTYHEDPIVAVFISATVGNRLVKRIKDGESLVLQCILNATEVEIEEDVIASFSSRGPTVDMEFGPDVTAPGVSIVAGGYATHTSSPRTGYGVSSGTSMSAPHVSGISALILEKHPEFTTLEVRSALMSTSVFKTVMTHRRDPAQPLDMGAGRVDAARALDPVLFLNPPAVAFNLTPRSSEATKFVMAVSSYSESDIALTARLVRHTGFNEVEDAESYLSVSPVSFTVPAGGKIDVTVSLATMEAGFGDQNAFLLFEDEDGNEVAHAPLWARIVCSEEEKVDILFLDFTLDNSSAYLKLYQDAADAGNFTHKFWKMESNMTDTLGDDVIGMCGKTMLLFSGDEAIDIWRFETAIRSIMHAKVPVIQMGEAMPYNWGLDDSVSTVYDAPYFEFMTYYTLDYFDLKKIKATSVTPPAFAAIEVPIDMRARVIHTESYEAVPLLTDESARVIAQAVSSNPDFEYTEPVFNSFTITCIPGMHDIKDEKARAQILKLFYEHFMEEVGECSVLVEGEEPAFTIKVECVDFDYVGMQVGWGDGDVTWKSTVRTDEYVLSHFYSKNGTYTPNVLVTSSHGRMFLLNTTNITINITQDHELSASTALSPVIVLIFLLALVSLF